MGTDLIRENPPNLCSSAFYSGEASMDRNNHYEAAFEGYLQWHRLSYIAVDETRRAMLGDQTVKNLDFIVHGESGSRLLVDIKGRRFPGGRPEKPRRVWQCWCARDDVDGLQRWEALFGADYQGLLVFTYGLAPAVALPEDTLDLWTWRGRRVPVPGCHGPRLSPVHARPQPEVGYR